MKRKIKIAISTVLVMAILLSLSPFNDSVVADLFSTTASAASNAVCYNTSYYPVSANADNSDLPTGNKTFYYQESPYINICVGENVFIHDGNIYIYRNGSLYRTVSYRNEFPNARDYFRYWAYPINNIGVGSYEFYFEFTYSSGSNSSNTDLFTSDRYSFNVIDRTPSLSLTKSSVSLDLDGVNSVTIYVTVSCDLSYEYYLNFNKGSSDFSASWGEWDGYTVPITITGVNTCSNEYLTISLKKKSDDTVIVTKNINVSVIKQSYSIIYNANGGSGTPNSQTGSGTVSISSTVPIRFGYTFLGWSKNSSATSASYEPGDSIGLSSNTTLYAVWKAATSISTSSTYSPTISFANQEYYYKFTPSSTKKYIIESTGSLDTKVYLYDSSGTELSSDDDGGDERNFKLSYSFTSGTTYYIKVRAYSSNTGSLLFSIKVENTNYSVSYNANGGSVSPTSTSVTEGSSVTLPTPTKNYTITYNANGGSGAPSSQSVSLSCKGWATSSSTSSASYSCGSSYKPTSSTTLYAVWNSSVSTTLSSTKPTRTGYTFQGWSTSSSATSASYSAGSSYTASGNVTLYAVWKPNTYTVSFNANGGSVSPTSASATEGNSVTLPTPTKKYTITYSANGGSGAPSSQSISLSCKGWATSSSASSASYSCGSSYKPTSSTTLYAVWNSSVSTTLSSTKPTRTGYTFQGWSTSSSATSASYSSGSSYTASGNVTLYAVWKAIGKYTVSYNANGGSVSPTSTSVTEGSSVTLPTPTKNYTITYNANGGSGAPSSQSVSLSCKGWATSSSTSSASYSCGSSYKPTSNTTLYAVWNSSASTTLSSTKPTRTGYTFQGWSTSSSATSASYSSGSSYTASGNVTLYAVWKAIGKYTVSYNANGGSVSPTSASVTEGNSVTLPTPTKKHTITYSANGGSGAPSSQSISLSCKGWATSSSASSASYSCGSSYKPTSSTTLYAVWNSSVSTTLSSTKPTRTGYTFQGWSTSSSATSASYSSGSSYTASGNVTLYAVWKAIGKYTVSYNANGGSVSPTSTSVTEGSSVTLPTPTKNYMITYSANGGSGAPSSQNVNVTCKGWAMSGSESTASFTCGFSYKFGSNTTLYAVWNSSASTTLSSTKPTRTGYTFQGWSTSSSATSASYSSGSSYTASSNVTLYAVWKKINGSALNDSDILPFSNSSNDFFSIFELSREYYMLDSDFIKLSDYAKKIYPNNSDKKINELQAMRRSGWGGSCYGMSAVTVLDKYGHIEFNENYDDAATMSKVDKPKNNIKVRSAINYYQIAQGISNELCETQLYNMYNANWKYGLKALVKDSQNGKAMMFGYFFVRNSETYGHEIVIKGYEQAANGDHRIIAYDNRYPTRDTYIVVDKNFETCVVDGTESVIQFDYFSDFSGFDKIDIDGPDNSIKLKSIKSASGEEYESKTTISFLANGDVTVENAEGKTIRYKDGALTGTMEKISERMIINSTDDGQLAPGTIVIDVPNSKSFAFESDNPHNKITVMSSTMYAFVNTENADTIITAENEGVYIMGKNFQYEVGLSLNNDICDMISVSGNSKNGTSVKFRGSGLKIDGGVGDKEITVFSDIVDMDTLNFKSSYEDVIISGSKSGAVGKIDIVASSKSNEEYDVFLVKESVTLPDAQTEEKTPTIAINNNPGTKQINYGEGIKFTATATDLPDGAKIVWFVNDKKAGEGESFTFSNATADATITVKIVDKNGNVLKDATGGEISESEKITVNAGFFQKLIAFFKKLFGATKVIDQAYIPKS